MAVTNRILRAWNAFRNHEETKTIQPPTYSYGSPTYSTVSNRFGRASYSSEQTIIASIHNRIAVDASEVELRHVKVDKDRRYTKDVNSSLNDILNFQANIDQSAEQFKRDICLTMLIHGIAAIVPIDVTEDAETGQVIDYFSMRVGRVTEWLTDRVRVEVYNEKTGIRQEIVVEKHRIALVENPFYQVMNEPNSTLKRLVRKLNLLDVVDEQSSSGKLDLIIQLPYVIKSQARKDTAEDRRKAIEEQLAGSQYGIAYTDATEKITQLNRPVENNLLAQIKYLKEMLYEQLGLTEAILNGTADEKAMLNYQNRTIVPIVRAVQSSIQRTIIGPEKYKKNERLMFFHDPFKFVPLDNIAEIADKFTRNEIATSNEIRSIIGFVPSSDPKADMLMNSNMPQDMLAGEVPAEGAQEGGEEPAETETSETESSRIKELEQTIEEMDAAMTEILDGIEKDVDDFELDGDDEDDED